MFGIHYFKVLPNQYILKYRKGQLVKEGQVDLGFPVFGAELTADKHSGA